MATVTIDIELNPLEIAEFYDTLPYTGELKKVSIFPEDFVVIKNIRIEYGRVKILVINSPVATNYEKNIKIPVKSGANIYVLAENRDPNFIKRAQIIFTY